MSKFITNHVVHYTAFENSFMINSVSLIKMLKLKPGYETGVPKLVTAIDDYIASIFL